MQSIWSRKFWGTPRDEAFLRRLDFLPRLAEAVEEKRWKGGVGLKPFYPGASPGEPKPLRPWKLSDKYLPNHDNFPQMVLQEEDFTTLKNGLEASVHQQRKIPAVLDGLNRKPADSVFNPPMVVFSEGFTKFAFSRRRVLFQASLRSITGPERDANLFRFLTAVLGSRLMQYQAFHSGSSNGIGRDKMHLYESHSLPFPLPNHELAPPNADEIVREVAKIFKQVERAGGNAVKRSDAIQDASAKLQPLVEAYYSVTDAEKMLIEDTLTLNQPSIHRSNIDANVPALAFPEASDRKQYADTLCTVLNLRARKHGPRISAEGRASTKLNLIFFTIIFSGEHKPYTEFNGDDELWAALTRVSIAARHDNRSLSYLRGFSYFDSDRLHMLKPATMRNWSRTAALNDADAIFEHLVRQEA